MCAVKPWSSLYRNFSRVPGARDWPAYGCGDLARRASPTPSVINRAYPSLKGGGRAAAGVVAGPVAVAALVVVVMMAARLAAASVLAAGLVGRQALDDAVARQHAAIDGEVAADHEGAHGRVLLRERVRFVR